MTLSSTPPPTSSPHTIIIDNYINGAWVPPVSDAYLGVTNPATELEIGRVALSGQDDVHQAVTAAQEASNTLWSGNCSASGFSLTHTNTATIKSRAALMLNLHALVKVHAHALAALIVQENGKNFHEALAEVAKGNETIEYACSLPQLVQGKHLIVSNGSVACQEERRPVGVVACIVPFNFPFMVPMWTIPIALVLGNCVIVKPSEKVPITMLRVMQLIEQAGFPPGVVNLIQGTQEAVQALIAHPRVAAVTLVGSSPVAASVALQCRNLHKKCLCLGGAKNHLVAIVDECHVESAAADICTSFAGCAGQRCMAASVLLTVVGRSQQSQLESQSESSSSSSSSSSSLPLQQQQYHQDLLLLNTLIKKAAAIQPGTEPGQMGPVISAESHARILAAIESAEKDGAKVLLDGRKWCRDRQDRDRSAPNSNTTAETTTCTHPRSLLLQKGHWIGPTILLHSSSHDPMMRTEIFGPVLSVYCCASWTEAIAIENNSVYGNAAAIYTNNGASAEWFTQRFRAGMLGVNIGIPVPREPFSFGGLYGTQSKYGDMDMTGDGGIEFFTNRIKVTTKWPQQQPIIQPQPQLQSPKNGNTGAEAMIIDRAHFSGSM